MLRTASRLSVVGLIAALVLVIAPAASYGDGAAGGVECSQTNPAPGCDAHAGTGGNGGSNTSEGHSSGDGKCRNPAGQEIPCERDGAWAGADGCYYMPVDPSPETIAALGGQPGGKGGWYLKTCYGTDGAAETGLGGPVWVAGAAPVISPAELARQARARLNLPQVTTNLSPHGDQLVGLPTWLALERSSWTRQSATAAVPGVSVTATARPVSVSWVMGDGTTELCAGPGTAWSPGTDPAKASPDCGHTYRRSSAGSPGAAFTVTVTVTWEVTWAGAGQTGTVPGLTTTGAVQVRVQESQAVIRP
ncbi:MAG: hypothetical protein QOH97_1242 [Actinoplanes sp.]|jgi:hypothetical protein|nr:hypothetical protein [Actinoplanes sp.]